MAEGFWCAIVILFVMCLRTMAQCPPVDPNVPGSCLSLCDDDSECTGGTLCCSNGCGFSCVAPDANGTSVGARFLKQPKKLTTTTTTTTEKPEPEETEAPETTKRTKPTTVRPKTTPRITRPPGGCIRGPPLRHTDGNILVCGFAAGDFACPPSHTCTFDTARGKFVCCTTTNDAPVALESQVNPCPEGEPLTNAAGGKLTCNAGTTGPCPQGTFCIVGVCCTAVARPFTGAVPINIGGGPNTDFSQKPGQCPVAQPSPPQANCPNECRFDGDCFGPNKCCFTGCGSKCQEAIPFGVDPNLPFNPNSFANGPNEQRQQPPIPQQRFPPPQNNNGQQAPTNFPGGPNGGDGQFNNRPNFQASFSAPQPTNQAQQPPLTRNFPNIDNRQPVGGQFPNPDNRPPNSFDNRPQGNFQFANNNPPPTLNVAPQPTFDVPQPVIQSSQPAQVIPPASQQNSQPPFSGPIPQGFVPFPNAPFAPNQNPPPQNFNGPQNDAAFERRNQNSNQQRSLAGSQKSQRLVVKRQTSDICVNFPCPRCFNCVPINNQPTCQRDVTCCPDGTIPTNCPTNVCESAKCPAVPNALCQVDSCGGICRAAFYIGEINVSCSLT